MGTAVFGQRGVLILSGSGPCTGFFLFVGLEGSVSL